MNDSQLLDAIQQHGYSMGLVYYLGLIVVQQIYKSRDRIGDALVSLAEQLPAAVHWFVFASKKRVHESISNQISNIYTNLYMLAELQPSRVLVMRFDYHRKGKKEYYTCSIMHEAVKLQERIKEQWDNIRAGRQMVQLLIIDTLASDSMEVYVPNVAEMPEGDMKDLMLSYDVQSFISTIITLQDKKYYTLFAGFHEPNGLEKAGFATLRVCAANIEKTITKTL